MIPFIAPIISAVSAIGTSWLNIRKVKAEGKIDITKAKIHSKIKRYEHMGQMDVEAMKGMQFSWKDEYILILMSIPMIMSFIPGLTEYAKAGFAVVDELPEWYTWSWMGIVTATYGLRTWTGWRK